MAILLLCGGVYNALNTAYPDLNLDPARFGTLIWFVKIE